MGKIFGFSYLQIAAVAFLAGFILIVLLSKMYLEGRTIVEMVLAVLGVFAFVAIILVGLKRQAKLVGDRPDILSAFATSRGLSPVKLVFDWMGNPVSSGMIMGGWKMLFTGTYNGRAVGLGMYTYSTGSGRYGSNKHNKLFAYTDCRSGMFEMNLQHKAELLLLRTPESMVTFGDQDLDAEFTVTANDPIKAKTMLDADSIRQIHAIIGDKSVRTWSAPNLSIAVGRKSSTSSYGPGGLLLPIERLPDLPSTVDSPEELVHVCYELGSMRRIDDSVLQAMLDLVIGLAEKAEK